MGYVNTRMYSPKRHMDVLERPHSGVPIVLAVVLKALTERAHILF